MEFNDQNIRHLISRERIAQLARDGQGARNDGRRSYARRELLRRLLGAAAHRRAGQAQPARR
jgi:hypothetical protein